MRAIPLLLTAVPLVIALGCAGRAADDDDDDDDDDGAEGEGEGGEGEGDGEGLPIYSVCEQSSACASGTCSNVFDGQFAANLCTENCTSDAQCDDLGVAGVCVFVSQTSRQCFPACAESADCPADTGVATCIDNFGQQGAGACIGLVSSGSCSDGACPDGESCGLLGTGRGFEFYCFAEGVVGSDGGEACDSDALDRQGAPCTDAAAHCPAGYTCDDVDGAPGTPERQCIAPVDETCAAFVCWEQGVCASSCTADADCPAGMRCEGLDVTAAHNNDDPLDDEPAVLPLCRPFVGSGTSCTDDAGCAAVPDEVCAFHADIDANQGGSCREPDAGAGVVGDACGDDPGTRDVIEPSALCASDLCIQGACSALCGVDSPTSDLVCTGGSCVNVSIDDVVFGLCFQGAACTNEASCGADERCEAFPEPGLDGATSSGSVVKRCVPAYGDADEGDACDPLLLGALTSVACVSDSTCDAIEDGSICDAALNICLPPSSDVCRSQVCTGDARCTGACAIDGDCAIDEVCGGAALSVDGGATFLVSGFCQHRPGSRTPCTIDGECAAVAGELCRPVTSLIDGTASGVCSLPSDATFADVGDPCGDLDGDGPGRVFGGCLTGICDDEDGDGEGVCARMCADDDDCDVGDACEGLVFGQNPDLEIPICRD